MSVDVVHARNCLAGDGLSSHSVGLGDGVAVRPGSNGETALEITKICNCCGRHRTGRAPSFEVDSTRVRIESSRVASSQPAGSVHSRDGRGCVSSMRSLKSGSYSTRSLICP